MSNSIEKKYTVIIPSRKIDENLEQCISQIRKFYKKLKIIVILDEINKKLIHKYIDIIVTENKTIGFKRNLAVKKTKTKYVCFIDSDAYPVTKWLDTVDDIFVKNKLIAGVGGPNLSPKTTNVEKKLVSRARKLSFVTLNKNVKSIPTKNINVDFLPSCNLIFKKSIYLKIGGMDEIMYSGEEIALTYKLKKKGYNLIFSPNVFVYHKDRDFKHFARQRLIYGSTGLRLSIKYPCLPSFQLLISSIPFFYLLSFFIFLINLSFLKIYLIGVFFILILCILNSIKINFDNNFFKSIKLTLISVMYPGFGLLLSFFFNDEKLRSFYTQR